MAEDRGSSTRSGVVARTFLVLQTIVAADQPVGVRDLARRTGLARSTVSRLVVSLEELGMIERTGDGMSRPGTALATLTPRSGPAPLVRDQLRPLLAELVDVFGESSALAIDDGASVLYLTQMSSMSAVRVPDMAAERHPFHVVAPGLALMATWDRSRLDEYLARDLRPATEHTMVEPRLLRARIDEIGRSGYAWAEEELDDEVNGLACIVTPDDGVPVAVSIYGPAYRLSPTVRPSLSRTFTELVRRRAAALL